jgi:hypothetical protein
MMIPLFSLLKKGTPFVWNEQCQSAFVWLINALSSYPVLRLPDFTKPFKLVCDASGAALGCVLAQIEES